MKSYTAPICREETSVTRIGGQSSLPLKHPVVFLPSLPAYPATISRLGALTHDPGEGLTSLGMVEGIWGEAHKVGGQLLRVDVDLATGGARPPAIPPKAPGLVNRHPPRPCLGVADDLGGQEVEQNDLLDHILLESLGEVSVEGFRGHGRALCVNMYVTYIRNPRGERPEPKAASPPPSNSPP